MLRGPTKISLDAKGRVSIPTKYRDRIAARCDGQMICTVDLRCCLLQYPLPDWEETERKLMRLPSLNPTAQKLKGKRPPLRAYLQQLGRLSLKEAVVKKGM